MLDLFQHRIDDLSLNFKDKIGNRIKSNFQGACEREVYPPQPGDLCQRDQVQGGRRPQDAPRTPQAILLEVRNKYFVKITFFSSLFHKKSGELSQI